MVQLEGLHQLNIPVSSGIEPAIFQLVVYCFNEVRHRMPQVRKLLIKRKWQGTYETENVNGNKSEQDDKQACKESN
jgi:hypothetical protein